MATPGGRSILIVDDEISIVEALAEILTWEGFSVVTAGHGRTALEQLAKAPVDIVLMDVMMPVMNGFDASRKIKENPATAEIPILMLSAKSQVYEQEQGLESGAAQYICKPFTPGELVEQVAQFLEAYGGKG